MHVKAHCDVGVVLYSNDIQCLFFFGCVIYNDTSSTNISKYNIFDTDYFANLNVYSG